MVNNISRVVPTPADPLDVLVYGPTTTPAPPAVSVAVPTAPVDAAPSPIRRVVFTNQLTPTVYTQLRQYEYWGRKAIHEMLDEALTAYFADKPEASQALPEKEQAKLRGKLLD